MLSFFRKKKPVTAVLLYFRLELASGMYLLYTSRCETTEYLCVVDINFLGHGINVLVM